MAECKDALELRAAYVGVVQSELLTDILVVKPSFLAVFDVDNFICPVH